MEICEKCGSGAFSKNGFVRGKQRYLCKVCGRNQTDGDGRKKYSEAVRNTAATLYLEGLGFRQIERVLRRIYSIKIHYQLVIHWIKRLGLKVENAIKGKFESKKIPVLELDELYSYVQKKQIKSEYGLLSIETGCVLLRLKWETEASKLSKSSGIE
jgi:transposase-like protein